MRCKLINLTYIPNKLQHSNANSNLKRMSWFNIIECFQSYGENCHYPCSQHCYNRNCDRYNGSCLTGCTGGFYGEQCEQGKYYLNYRKFY